MRIIVVLCLLISGCCADVYVKKIPDYAGFAIGAIVGHVFFNDIMIGGIIGDSIQEEGKGKENLSPCDD